MHWRRMIVLQNITNNKVKYFLTVCSIVIGIALMIAISISITSSMKQFEQMSQEVGTYVARDSNGQSEQYLNQYKALFLTLSGFGSMAMFLSLFLLSSVTNDFILKMKKHFTILKVLGAKKSDIFKLVMENMLSIFLLGAMLGGVGGLAIAELLLGIIEKTLDTEAQIAMIVNPVQIISIICLSLLVVLISTIPKSLHAMNQEVVTGLATQNASQGILLKKVIRDGICLVALAILRLFFQDNDVVTNYFTMLIFYFTIHISIPLTYRGVSAIASRILGMTSPLNAFTIKATLLRSQKRIMKQVFIIAIIGAFSLSMLLMTIQIAKSVRELANTLYYGDIVVSSMTEIAEEEIRNIEQIPGVIHAYPQYQKMVNVADVESKIKGVRWDEENCATYDITRNEVEMLNQDSILASKELLRVLGLEVNETIVLHTVMGEKPYTILDSFDTIEHDGKVILMSQDNFQADFDNYYIDSILIYKNPNIHENQLIKEIQRVVDPTMVVTNVEDATANYIEQNSIFVYLLYGMVFILFIASALVIINYISISIRNNSYTLGVLKLLGTTNMQLAKQTIIENSIYAIWGIVIGELFSVWISRYLANQVVRMMAYSIEIEYKKSYFILFAVAMFVTIMMSAILAVTINYKKAYTRIVVE